MLKTVNSLNSVIEKELMLNHFDDGKKLSELLATAKELYRNLCSVSAQYQDNSINNVILPNEIIVLGDNIKRLESVLGLDNSNEMKGQTK